MHKPFPLFFFLTISVIQCDERQDVFTIPLKFRIFLVDG